MFFKAVLKFAQQLKLILVAASIYLYHKFYPKRGMLYIFTMTTPQVLPWPSIATATATANSSITLDGALDGATIIYWAHDPDCQHRIACDTIEEGSLNH